MTLYDELRAALIAELDEPGAITRDEVRAVLDRFPPSDPTPEPLRFGTATFG